MNTNVFTPEVAVFISIALDDRIWKSPCPYSMFSAIQPDTLTPASGKQVPWSHTSNVVANDAGVSSACFRAYNCSMWNIK